MEAAVRWQQGKTGALDVVRRRVADVVVRGQEQRHG